MSRLPSLSDADSVVDSDADSVVDSDADSVVDSDADSVVDSLSTPMPTLLCLHRLSCHGLLSKLPLSRGNPNLPATTRQTNRSL